MFFCFFWRVFLAGLVVSSSSLGFCYIVFFFLVGFDCSFLVSVWLDASIGCFCWFRRCSMVWWVFLSCWFS